MIQVEHIETWGWEAAIRGMRNPKNSWHLSDSYWVPLEFEPQKPSDFFYNLGDNDRKLAMSLIKAGPEHCKFLRDVHVQFDVVAPVFWYSEFDTYKVATTRNSCSKMHKIHVKPFELSDFAHEGCDKIDYALGALLATIDTCERLRNDFNREGNRDYWRALIELLPESYMMRTTWDGSLKTVLDMEHQRKGHKLYEEWRQILTKLFQKVPYLEDFYKAVYGGDHECLNAKPHF